MPRETTHPADHANDTSRLLDVLRSLVTETQPEGTTRAARITLDSRLEGELGLDSLARAELMLRLAREFAAPLPDAALAQAQTPRDLLRYIAQLDGHSPSVGSAPTTQALPEQATSGVPEDAQTLVEVLRWHATRNAARTHVLLYDDDEHVQAITYGELLTDAERVAAGLQARGLRPRQTVALMLPTGRAYLTTFFGVMLAGAIPVPIYPPARLAQIEDHLQRHAQILANAQTAFLVTVPQAKAIAALLRTRVPELREILDAAELAAPASATVTTCPASPDDIAFLQYTSGSTGSPKGVVLSHANLLANLRAMGSACRVDSADVFVSWLPLYHDMGLIGAWFGALYFAFPLVLMSPLAFLARPMRWLAAISRHRATISAAPNFAYELCARKIDDTQIAQSGESGESDECGECGELGRLDLSSWRLALNGAEPVSAATLDAFATRFAPYGLRREAITPVYGLAENSVGLAFPPPGRGPRIDIVAREPLAREQIALPASPDMRNAHATLQVVACGYPLPGHQIRIVDSADGELPERHVGRLQFRGPSATAAYYRNAGATQALIRGGWLDSGDLAYCADGEIFLTGRVKDLIIRGGRNVYPYELEQAVGSIDGVRKGGVAVFASHDARGVGETLVVVAETRETEPARRESLRQRIAETTLDVIGIAADDIVLLPPNAVLKTSSGKIRRAASREAYEGGTLGAPCAYASAWRVALRLGVATWRARVAGQARRVARWSFALWCWLAFLVVALPTVLFICAAQAPPLARRVAHRAARLMLAASGLTAGQHGVEQLSDADRLLLVNHCSYLDALLLCALLPARHDYVFVAKREFAGRWVARAFLRGLGSLYVERHAAPQSVEDVDALVGALSRGARLIVFPEGTFTREAGLRAFHMGAFVAAQRAHVALRIAALRGTREVLRDGSWLPRRAPLSLTVGERLSADGDDWAAAVRLRDAARAHMLALCGEGDLAR